MKMDYRRDLQHNYLVVETGEKTENYITRMMTENQVQGLLGCECRRMDQKKLYYYDTIPTKEAPNDEKDDRPDALRYPDDELCCRYGSGRGDQTPGGPKVDHCPEPQLHVL